MSSSESLEVRPAPLPRRVIDRDGRVLTVPDDWALLPPGDAALSRRVKADGPSWTVIEIRRGKKYSHGIWAPAARIAALRLERDAEKVDPAYQRKLAAGRQRRAAEQADYVEDFRGAVLAFLDFHPRYRTEAEQLATLIAGHATPVGSGTVARTERIPIEQRAEAATIAWMRHQTTGYDTMFIGRAKGARREMRQLLAEKSRRLLRDYRHGETIDTATCPLARALRRELDPNAPPELPDDLDPEIRRRIESEGGY